MIKVKYGNEALDTRLLIIFFVKNLRFLIYGVLLWGCLFAACYYLKENIWSGEKTYTAEGIVYLQYADDVRLDNIYINDKTWPILKDSDEIIDPCEALLSARGYFISKDEIRAMTEVNIETDVRMLIIRAMSQDPGVAVEVCCAMEETIIENVPSMKDVDAARIFTAPEEAKVMSYTDRTLRSALSGAVFGFVSTILIMFVFFICDTSIYVPSQVEQRYGIPVLGVLVSALRRKNSEETEFYFDNVPALKKKKFEWNRECIHQNYKHILREYTKIAVVDTSIATNTDYVMRVLNAIKRNLAEDEVRRIDSEELKAEEAHFSKFDYELVEVDALNQNAEVVEELRKYEAVIVLIQAEDHNGGLLERSFQYLKKQDVNVKAAILYDADPVLMEIYTFSPFSKSAKHGIV